jgi:hypothetical protein
MLRSTLAAGVLAACSHAPSTIADPDAPPPQPMPPDAAPMVDTRPLVIDTLGVQGFVLRHGDDIVLTAPLFTRQSAIEVALNLPLDADVAAIDAGLATVPGANVRAIISGHAHYDHLMDVPRAMQLAPGSVLATNLSGRNVLAALAPDSCGTPGTLARSRVIAMDDPLTNHVDYTNCPDQAPAGAGSATWLVAPGGHVRVMGFCSQHPAQVGPYHFGAGSIDHEQCALPAAASGWLEGQTLAILVDFLDDGGKPLFRVFYQDAPTIAPIGHVPDAILAEHGVDVALLCAGSADAVPDHPGQILANLAPRVALSGHWEDFFIPATAPIQAQPLLDVNGYVARAEAALPGRHTLVYPGQQFMVPPP